MLNEDLWLAPVRLFAAIDAGPAMRLVDLVGAVRGV
jgi:hypothetical protein